MRPLNRTKRWAKAISDAQAGVADLIEIQEEYQEWRDNIPENLEESAVVEKLDAVVELDLEEINGLLEEAEYIELPLGFGRD